MTDVNEPFTLNQLCNMVVQHITEGRCYVLELGEHHTPNENLKTYTHAKANFLKAQQLHRHSNLAAWHQGHVNNVERFNKVLGSFTE